MHSFADVRRKTLILEVGGITKWYKFQKTRILRMLDAATFYPEARSFAFRSSVVPFPQKGPNAFHRPRLPVKVYHIQAR